jgi:hypothetical protein
MKISELLMENQDLDEAPMGIMKRAGLGLASKFSSKASGKLASGKESNELRKDFDFYLGSSNQKATAKSLMQFLNQEGHPTDTAQKSIAAVPGADQNPETPIPNNVINQIFTSIAQSNVSSGKVTPTQPTSLTQQPAAGQTAIPNYARSSQVKDAVNKMSDDEKRDLIKHLKATDKFGALKTIIN